MSETATQIGSAARDSADMLFGFWYPAASSSQIGRNRMTTAMLLEIPLVLGRDRAGRAFAMRDVCPHRALPLSFGRFEASNRRVHVSRLAIRRAQRPVRA